MDLHDSWYVTVYANLAHDPRCCFWNWVSTILLQTWPRSMISHNERERDSSFAETWDMLLTQALFFGGYGVAMLKTRLKYHLFCL